MTFLSSIYYFGMFFGIYHCSSSSSPCLPPSLPPLLCLLSVILALFSASRTTTTTTKYKNKNNNRSKVTNTLAVRPILPLRKDYKTKPAIRKGTRRTQPHPHKATANTSANTSTSNSTSTNINTTRNTLARYFQPASSVYTRRVIAENVPSHLPLEITHTDKEEYQTVQVRQSIAWSNTWPMLLMDLDLMHYSTQPQSHPMASSRPSPSVIIGHGQRRKYDQVESMALIHSDKRQRTKLVMELELTRLFEHAMCLNYARPRLHMSLRVSLDRTSVATSVMTRVATSVATSKTTRQSPLEDTQISSSEGPWKVRQTCSVQETQMLLARIMNELLF
ncbi:hypothetical protein BDF14DRAFT_498094 [Spinellus fusiger]|nr:hypothetical protein BDF14DRAFT_498094 [Spinellus fusiger]